MSVQECSNRSARSCKHETCTYCVGPTRDTPRDRPVDHRSPAARKAAHDEIDPPIHLRAQSGTTAVDAAARHSVCDSVRLGACRIRVGCARQCVVDGLPRDAHRRCRQCYRCTRLLGSGLATQGHYRARRPTHGASQSAACTSRCTRYPSGSAAKQWCARPRGRMAAMGTVILAAVCVFLGGVLLPPIARTVGGLLAILGLLGLFQARTWALTVFLVGAGFWLVG